MPPCPGPGAGPGEEPPPPPLAIPSGSAGGAERTAPFAPADATTSRSSSVRPPSAPVDKITEVAALTAEAATSAKELPAVATTVPTALPNAPAVWLITWPVGPVGASPPDATGALIPTGAELGASVVPAAEVMVESVLAAPTVESVPAMLATESSLTLVGDAMVGPIESVGRVVSLGVGSTVPTGAGVDGGGGSGTGALSLIHI